MVMERAGKEMTAQDLVLVREVPTNENTHRTGFPYSDKYREVTRDDLLREDKALARDIFRMARRYGYDF